MHLSENVFAANLNAVCHVGGFYSIKKGVEWKKGDGAFAQNKFYYIKSGNCKITINGKEYAGIPGRWFLIPAGAPHAYNNDKTKPFSKHWMHFDIYPDNMNFFESMDLPCYVDVPPRSKADKLFKGYFKNAADDTMTSVFDAKAMLLALIAEYVRLAAPATKIQMLLDPMVKAVSEFIENNMERTISLDELAQVCHLHPTHFIRAFKKKTGETPARYIQLRKMETAKRLLEETQLPLSEIMNIVGMVDAAQFSKKFHSFYGKSPSSYRKLIQGMNERFKK